MKIEVTDRIDLEKVNALRVFFNEYYISDFGVTLSDGKVIYNDN